MNNTFAKAATAVVVVSVAVIALGVGYPRDDTDTKDGARSGVYLRTDHLTGCQYLEGARGGITPRVDAKGEHLGCKP